MTITIKKGKTFSRVLRPTAPPYIYKAITAVTKAGPVQITAPTHGLVDGQYTAVVSVEGMTQINARLDSAGLPRLGQYHKVTVVDVNTVTINDINSSAYDTYTSGGYLQFLTPVDMASCTARMTIKDRVGGTELVSLTTENGGIVLDNANHTITVTISAAATAAFTWRRGVTDLELVAADGRVTEIEPPTEVIAEDEVTT